MKHFIPTNRIPSNMAQVANAGQIKHSRALGWERSRKVPVSLANERAIEEYHDTLHDLVEKARADHAKVMGGPSGVICCKRIAGNCFHIVGHGIAEGKPRIVASFDEVKAFAKSIGYHTVVMGAVRAHVE